MAFDHTKYNHGTGNDATPWGVVIEKSQVAQNEIYYAAITVHHLYSDENMGNHNVYLDVLDEEGKRINGALVDFNWVGMRDNQKPNPAKIDKTNKEPGADIAIHGGQIISVWVRGTASDIVRNLRTDHGPDGQHNYMGHHSFYVVFKKVRKGTELPPENPDEELPLPKITKTFVLAEDSTMKVSLVIETK